jgi:hypothetical protein
VRANTRVGRALIFLAVLVFHFAIILVLFRARQIVLRIPVDSSLQLLLLAPAAARAEPPPQTTSPSRARERRTDHQPPDNAIALPPQIPAPPPSIDWDKEIELAVQSSQNKADKEVGYRNLAALTPAQRDWLQQNHMEPGSPGITWKQSRVEVTPGGFPIIHINDHCVLVPFLMMMVFCKIGHIEPNGKLFEHMRDREAAQSLE